MPRGISIHIGLNFVDPNRYNGWDGQLFGCINDARDMQAIANALHYPSTLMTDSQATAAAVVQAIGRAAQQLNAGDTLLLTYSGHGGQVPDVNGEESDAQDETWVLWDRMLLDDELYSLWAQFRAGVRIFVLSDSCHSGTVLRMQMYQQMTALEPVSKQYRRMKGTSPSFRLIPPHIQNAVYERDRGIYDTAQWTTGGDRAPITASVLLISGCQDNQLSADGERNGLFTETLLDVWDHGSFIGTYSQFHSAIAARMPPTQTPNFYRVGVANPTFEAEKPFTSGADESSGGTETERPTIQGPSSLTQSSTPPQFSVNPGRDRYYVVEVATRADLFNYAVNGSQRTADNFFGSWSTRPFSFSVSYPVSYTLPGPVWERLRRNTSRLYYRLWASDSPESWVNHIATTPDHNAAAAPFLAIAREVAAEQEETAMAGAASVY